MQRKKVITVILIITVLLAGLFGYNYLVSRKNERAGKEKFSKAITELRTEGDSFDNPCLGTSVLRQYSYDELSNKSIDEIKDLAKRDPGSC
jgi:hypothetical protein